MPTYADWQANPYQFGLEDYNTSTPEGDQQAVSYAPGWIPELLDLRQKVESGQGSAWDREYYQQQAQAARAVPMRDPRSLQYNAGDDAPDRLSGGSPDLGNLMLTLQDRMRSGQATEQEQELFRTTYANLANQNWRASVPQESDAFNPLGDNLFGALGTLALGATGGLAGGALAAGGGLASTLGSLGTLAGTAGTGAGVLGQATDQDWLSTLGMALGAAGGLAGGVSGLTNLAGTGVQSLSDAARLAQSAGRITGTLGRVTDNEALTQAGGYLGTAGGLGGGIENLRNLLGGTGGSVQGLLGLAKPLAGLAGRFLQSGQPGQSAQSVSRPVTAAPQQPLYGAADAPSSQPGSGMGASGIQRLLQAVRQAQQRGGMQASGQSALTNADWMRIGWPSASTTSYTTLGNL